MELFNSFRDIFFQLLLPKSSHKENYEWFPGEGTRCGAAKVRKSRFGQQKGTGIGACRTGVAPEPTNDGVKVRCLPLGYTFMVEGADELPNPKGAIFPVRRV